jgi:hypothetical protein
MLELLATPEAADRQDSQATPDNLAAQARLAHKATFDPAKLDSQARTDLRDSEERQEGRVSQGRTATRAAPGSRVRAATTDHPGLQDSLATPAARDNPESKDPPAAASTVPRPGWPTVTEPLPPPPPTAETTDEEQLQGLPFDASPGRLDVVLLPLFVVGLLAATPPLRPGVYLGFSRTSFDR